MINIENKKNCCGCSACCNICPENAIKMERDNEGFLYPVIDKEKCISCQLCEKICPVYSKCPDGAIKAFGAYSHNENERLNSSSGGIFSLISKKILSEGGIVYGAMFDEELKLYHGCARNYEELKSLMGSKYLQSNNEISYKRVKENLKNGVKVLYSGTPCQIAGLKAYLQKEYDNLYLVDIICHGVASPKAFDVYKNHLEKKYHSKIIDYQFRAKPYGWRNYETYIAFENKKEISEAFTKNLYMRCFLKNVMLRPSCYDCSFKTIPKHSDLTLGDFWGIAKVSDFKDDDKGLSLILVNNKKGEELFSSIQSDITSFEVDGNEAIKMNSSAVKSANLPSCREEFLNGLTPGNFRKKAYAVLKPGFKNELKLIIKHYFKKIINTKKDISHP